MTEFPRPRVVVSKCIEFDYCRYNGSIISSQFVQKLKDYVDFITVCPEVEIGLGIPREAVRLVTRDDKILLLNSMNGEDHTPEMNSFSSEYLSGLKNINGFILKSRSPSCGIKEVKLYGQTGKVPAISSKSSGIFAKYVLDRFNYLAIEDEGRLTNLQIRQHFLTKLYTLTNFEMLEHKSGELVTFHSQNKYLFMAYNQSKLKIAGKIVANHQHNSIEEVFQEYRQALYQIFQSTSRIGSNINVLMHILGYFSKHLSVNEKAHFLEQLEFYRSKRIPLIVLTSILKSWSLRFDMAYLLQQTYFDPFPAELMDTSNSGKGRVNI
ncbi:MAG: DUF523 and DUF1722 domain-containing protein [Candidatus Cloacimonetes bacterium]|nr:DUF523 and DUF1722 domain-containing protein [Candidatus Cloacimonadota bacterium]